MTVSPMAFDWLAEVLADPDTELSLGAFGAFGQFTGNPRHVVARTADAITVTTPSATVRLRRHEALLLVAYEMLSSDPQGWNHAVALCLPEAQARRAEAMPTLCADGETLMADEVHPPLFDLRLGASYADVGVRALPGDGAAAEMKAFEAVGAEEALARFSNHLWVFQTSLGRLEVRHARRCYVLPALLRGGKTHATTAPIPVGMVPIGYVFPPNAWQCAASEFELARLRHHAFQDVLDQFGRPDLLRLKRELEAALAQGKPPSRVALRYASPAEPNRAERTCLRVTLRQYRWQHPEADVAAWIHALDPALSAASHEVSTSGQLSIFAEAI